MDNVVMELTEVVPINILLLREVCKSFPLSERVPMYALVEEETMKEEYMVDDEYVKSKPPERVSLVLVAAEGKGYAKVLKPESLLNQES